MASMRKWSLSRHRAAAAMNTSEAISHSTISSDQLSLATGKKPDEDDSAEDSGKRQEIRDAEPAHGLAEETVDGFEEFRHYPLTSASEGWGATTTPRECR